MRQVEQHIEVAASAEAVWAVLADLTSMRHYMPRTESVKITSDGSQGIGAARYCVFADGVELGERVVEWDEGSGYVLETTKVVKVPMQSNRVTFRIEPQGEGTIVRETMEYSMKGGFVAPLLERLAAGRMQAAMAGSLGGLKAYVEAGVEDGADS